MTDKPTDSSLPLPDKEPQHEEKKKRKKKRPPLQDLEPNIAELVFVRIFDPIHIPSYLVEQIKDRLYTVEKFYEFQRLCCLFSTDKGPILNPTNFLYALIDQKKKETKGFLWMSAQVLTESLIINNFSVDAAYWGKGESIKLVEKKAKKVMSDLKLKRIVWITKNVRFCEALGFKHSKESVMIYEE